MKKIFNLVFCLLNIFLIGQTIGQTTSLVSIDSTGKLTYTPDSKGNTLPDFSGVGYMNSEVAIPTVAVVKTVYPVAGDNLANIQNAINEVAAMPLGPDGFRGAILFKAGLYNISDSINITASGIVLRGEGKDTTTGTRFNASSLTQYSLINFSGAGTATATKSTKVSITSSYVPIGATQLTLASNSFKVGDSIMVTRNPDTAWITLIGMNTKVNGVYIDNWTNTSCNISYLRKVTAVSGDTITIDAPMVDVIDPLYAKGTVSKYKATWASLGGVENMSITSNYTTDTAENHGWEAIDFNNFKNGWVRNVDVYYFAYAAVQIYATSAWITVDSCKMIDAKCGALAGFSFHYEGQRCLTKNCWTRNGNHDYVIGTKDSGPNVFLNSISTKQQMDIGPHLHWGTGCLFDNITSDGIQEAINRANEGAGVGQGWGGAQICYWNCTAPSIEVQDIPGDERNWAIGCVASPAGGYGITNRGNKNAIEAIGDTESINHPITAIPSLFNAQLNARLGTFGLQSQSISFDTLATVNLGDSDFTPSCAASSGLPITLTSMNTSVANIVNGKIHIVGLGTAIINASQIGDSNYKAAPVYGQLLTVAASLPVQIKNITATLISKNVLISWEVANEVGIKKYKIEKSIDGNNNFSTIGSVNSNNKTAYSFTDVSPVFPAYYRLKIASLDGSIKFSNSLLVNKSANNISIYPNPVNNNLTVAGLAGKSTIKITNTMGQKVLEQNTSANSLNLDVTGLKSGTYILSITDDADRVAIKKFIKE